MGCWGSPGRDQLYCEGWHKLAAPGWAVGRSSRLMVPHTPGPHWEHSLCGLLLSLLLLCLLPAVGQREEVPSHSGADAAYSESEQRPGEGCGQLIHPPPKEQVQDPEQIHAEALQPAQAAHQIKPLRGVGSRESGRTDQAQRYVVAHGPQLPPSTMLPHPVFLRSEPWWGHRSTRTPLLLHPTPHSAQWCYSSHVLASIPSSEHQMLFRGCVFQNRRIGMLSNTFSTTQEIQRGEFLGMHNDFAQCK